MLVLEVLEHHHLARLVELLLSQQVNATIAEEQKLLFVFARANLAQDALDDVRVFLALRVEVELIFLLLLFFAVLVKVFLGSFGLLR